MSLGLSIDQGCISLSIPKLLPEVGKPQILIHKLDSTSDNSKEKACWECYWLNKLAQDSAEKNNFYLSLYGGLCQRIVGVKVSVYC
jgi:hypothetical protein